MALEKDLVMNSKLLFTVMLKASQRIVLVLLLICFYSISASALETKTRALTYDLQLNFAPTEAFFFLRDSRLDKIERAKAVLYLNQKPDEDDKVTCTAAIPLSIKRVKHISHFSLIFIGSEGNYHFVPEIAFDPQEHQEDFEQHDLLREEQEEQEGKLLELKDRLAGLNRELERLKADARVVGRFDRVEQIEDKIVKARQILKNLDADINHAKDFVSLVQEDEEPHHFSRRELQLTMQLKELAAAAKEAEAGEKWRSQQSEQQLQQHLRLVELTRELDPEVLRLELIQLRRKRQALEQRNPPSAVKVPDYEEYRP